MYNSSDKDQSATLTAAAVDILREMIIQGDLRPGEHVQENRICSILDMSRTPVRSAFAVLKTEGYLVYYPNRGYFVREFEVADLREQWELRAVLEALGARKCAERGISKEDETILLSCLASGDRILDRGFFERNDVEPYRQMNMTFHETLLRASGLKSLPNALKATQNVPLVSKRILVWQDFEHLKRSHDDHHRVVDAVLAREGARAEALMREHVYYAGIFVSNHVSRQEPGQVMRGMALLALADR